MTTRRRLVGRATTLTGLVFVAATALGGTSAWAGVELDTAQADIEIAADGSSRVQLDYRVTGTEDGQASDAVSFSALSFNGATVEDVQVTTAAGAVLDHQAETTNGKTTILVTLPDSLPAGEDEELVFTYSVPDAGVLDGEELTTHVPIVAADVPASGADPGTFTATVELPAGHTLVEGFPAKVDDVAEAGGLTVLRYSVPAVPALIRVVTTTGEPTWLGTTEAQVELILLLVLVGGLVAIYYSFLRPLRAAQANASTNGGAGDAGTPAQVPTYDESRGL